LTIATTKQILATCSDEAPEAALLPLAFDVILKLEDMPSKLGLGFEPWRLPGAAVPDATYFQYANAVWMLGVGASTGG
jgi:hypothetical protein